jgi:hypothetical protein
MAATEALRPAARPAVRRCAAVAPNPRPEPVDRAGVACACWSGLRWVREVPTTPAVTAAPVLRALQLAGGAPVAVPTDGAAGATPIPREQVRGASIAPHPRPVPALRVVVAHTAAPAAGPVLAVVPVPTQLPRPVGLQQARGPTHGGRTGVAGDALGPPAGAGGEVPHLPAAIALTGAVGGAPTPPRAGGGGSAGAATVSADVGLRTGGATGASPEARGVGLEALTRPIGGTDTIA